MNDSVSNDAEGAGDGDNDGTEWWNNLTGSARSYWLERAGTAMPERAWEFFQACTAPPRPAPTQGELKRDADFLLHLLALVDAAHSGNADAATQLRFAGELLNFAGGVALVDKVLERARDFQPEHSEPSTGRDLTDHLSSRWGRIVW